MKNPKGKTAVIAVMTVSAVVAAAGVVSAVVNALLFFLG